ncbi:MAG: zinc ABC transporter substrate-binding protein [Actinomycetota bacterium]|nr:zinc ABC transporter substrate-binding protein [Actinomycetota bacterium]MDQ2958163.1 zinc ABC transporter substrate-binding protein [Actinomycetota bacterium]
MNSRPTAFRLAAIGASAVLLAGCATSPGSGTKASAGPGSTQVITAAASINAWGSILAQLGGSHVRTTSIISNPDTDPHDYEPTPADGKVIATASLFVENGVGYDSWADKAIKANPDPDRTVIDVGRLTATPTDGNPHRWYSPTDVNLVADAITAALKKADPADADYFDSQRQALQNTGLAEYHRLIQDIKTRYAGTPVGASESIFAPLAEALGLDLRTPASFLRAISEGTDPSASDKATIDSQISGKKIKVYVFNSQNATPDVAAQVSAAKQAGIPVATVTETLSPRGASFQDWQVGQLKGLEAALAQATGK